MRNARYLLLLPIALWGCSDRVTGPNGGLPSGVPSIGDVLTYNVAFTCNASNRDERQGRVVAVTQRTVVVVDENNPGSGLSDSEYAGFAAVFDTLAYPVVAENFGEPTDLDQNGRIVAFFTRAVNEMSDSNGRSFIAGVFWPGDLFPRTNQPGFEGCPNSNYAEIFYLAVPDPDGDAGRAVSRDQIRRLTVATMGHELQHLVNAARRLYINQSAEAFEELWLNEGLSHITEELLFYRAGSSSPGTNLDADALRASQRRTQAFFEFHVQNVVRLADFLEEPADTSASLLNGNALASRGANWHFLRYAADRLGSQRDFWWSLVNTNGAGMDNLRESLGGEEPTAWIRDWTATVYADDEAPVESRYRFPSWNLRDLYPALRDGSNEQIFPEYPLRIRSLDDGKPLELDVAGQAAEYVRVLVPAGGEAEVSIRSGGVAPPAQLHLSVVNRATGDVFHRAGAEAESVTLEGGAQETAYLIVPVHSAASAGATLSLELASEGANPAPVAERMAFLDDLAPRIDSVRLFGEPVALPALDETFHLELHRRARRELEPLVPAARAAYRELMQERRLPQ